MNTELRLEESWKSHLKDELDKPYFQSLQRFLESERASGHPVFPAPGAIFSALQHTPLDSIRVVIIGQDPYHGEGQAHGLSFSVKEGVRFPPSLRNIFTELASDLGCDVPASGNLEGWAKQGVLLLNATLTVRANEAGSHQKKGWEPFTDRIIELVSQERDHVVFMLWGRYAQSKEHLIHPAKHLLLKAAHPSPLSAYNGFFGCRHFSKANQWLQDHGLGQINWQL